MAACSTARVPPVNTHGLETIPVSVEDSCDGLEAHEFRIEDAERDGDFLLVQVIHAGGCGPQHSYAACWSDEILASEPPSYTPRLFHDAGTDMCEALAGEVLRIPVPRELQPSFLHETSVVLN